MHGPTFMANPIACSVALCGIEIFEEENFMEKIKRIEAIEREEMDGFTHPKIEDVRVMGGCVCIEVKDEKDICGFQEFAYERGVFARPFIKYIYSMVPYVISEDELRKVMRTMKEWFEK